jgi:hypothetical protein
MPVQDNNRVRWQYVSDDGTTYAISAKAEYVLHATDGSKYGGAAAGATHRRIPKDCKPRRVKCTAAGYDDKWVIAYSDAATIWTTPGTVLQLNANGADVTYASTLKKRAETFRDTVTQSS